MLGKAQYIPKTTKECLFLMDKGYLLSNVHNIMTYKKNGISCNTSRNRKHRPYSFTNPHYWRVLSEVSIIDRIRIKLKLI